MVTLLLRMPPSTTYTDTALPVGALDGICTLICQSPTKPGASPENCTAPKTLLPNTTQTAACWRQPCGSAAATVLLRASCGGPGAPWPSVTGGLVEPCPVAYNETTELR